MFDSIIIINLLETTIYQNPTDPSEILKKFLTTVKKSCIKNCTQPNLRFIKKIHILKDKEKIRKKVYARINDQSIIVAIIVPILEKNEIKIWETIDEIFETTEMVDVNEPKELEEIKPVLNELLRNVRVREEPGEVFLKEKEEMVYKSGLDSIQGSNIVYDGNFEENDFYGDGYVEGEGFFDKNMKLVFFVVGAALVLFVILIIFLINIFK